MNLNELEIIADIGFESLKNNNTEAEDKSVRVYFRNIEAELIKHILSADVVVGAIAWLTSYPVLDALAKAPNVSIIVQKEDFLRPDMPHNMKPSKWKRALREKYEKLKSGLDRYCFETILGEMSVCGDPSLDPIRCVGNHNADQKPAFPRMHNKFLLFCNIKDGLRGDQENPYHYDTVEPYGVWTGSFNFTQNATRSFENALYLTDSKIVNAYLHEYSQIAALSEPLNWAHEWVAPEWRIGT